MTTQLSQIANYILELNPFSTNVTLSYRRYKSGTLVENGLTILTYLYTRLMNSIENTLRKNI